MRALSILIILALAGCASPAAVEQDPPAPVECRTLVVLADREVTLHAGARNAAGSFSGSAPSIPRNEPTGRITAILTWQAVHAGAERLHFSLDMEGPSSIFAVGTSPLAIDFEPIKAIGGNITFMIRPEPGTLPVAVLLLDQQARLVVEQEVAC